MSKVGAPLSPQLGIWIYVGTCGCCSCGTTGCACVWDVLLGLTMLQFVVVDIGGVSCIDHKIRLGFSDKIETDWVLKGEGASETKEERWEELGSSDRENNGEDKGDKLLCHSLSEGTSMKRELSERFDGFWKTAINSLRRLDKDRSEAGDASRFTLLVEGAIV